MKEEEKIILSRAEIPNDAKDLRIATEIAQSFAKYIWEKLDAKAIKPDLNGTTQFEPFLYLKDVRQILQIEEQENEALKEMVEINQETGQYEVDK